MSSYQASTAAIDVTDEVVTSSSAQPRTKRKFLSLLAISFTLVASVVFLLNAPSELSPQVAEGQMVIDMMSNDISPMYAIAPVAPSLGASTLARRQFQQRNQAALQRTGVSFHPSSKSASRGSTLISNSVTKKPDLSDPVLRAKLAKGMGHNYYGEPAWPNDLLYIFPVVILGTIALSIGLAVMEPTQLGEPADPFATPLEILPEWYFFPTFNALRVIPNKLLGVLSMAAVPVGLLTVPFLESINKFQNPFRRPVATSIFLIGTFYAIWMGIGATMPIDKAITLGVF